MRDRKPVFKSNDEKFPNFIGEEATNTNPRNTESPNQEEPKEAHFKTHDNGKIPRQRENLEGSKGEKTCLKK